jgi:hypothetical protein
LLLLCFFITFFFPSILTPHQKRFSLYTTTFNDERKVTLSFLLLYPSLSHHD